MEPMAGRQGAAVTLGPQLISASLLSPVSGLATSNQYLDRDTTRISPRLDGEIEYSKLPIVEFVLLNQLGLIRISVVIF